MNKLIKAISLSIILSVAAFAQTLTQTRTDTGKSTENKSDKSYSIRQKSNANQTTMTGEYNKNEFYAGYSFQRIDEGNYRNYNGFEVAYVRNIRRYVGIKGDFSAAFKKDRFNISLTDNVNGTYSYRADVKNSQYNILGGIQIKDNASTRRLKPFGHALAGIAIKHFESNISCTSGNCPSFITNASKFSFTGARFSAAFGGGLDIKINDRFDFRAIQVDYNPVFTSGVQNNFRFGIGLVIK